MKVDIYNTDKQYNIIYADPPWNYKVWSQKGASRSASVHYDVMEEYDLKKMSPCIQSLTAKDCALFMWVTYPCLLEGIELIKEWGFTYKTGAFSWVKQNRKSDKLFMGMGYYTRSNNEICLLATKGKPLQRVSKSVPQIVMSHVEAHSKKPDIVRDRIVDLFGDIPRVELFARQITPGWDCWGNEI